MIKDWDVKEICQEIRKITRATNDKYMDGFNTWGCKKTYTNFYGLYKMNQINVVHTQTKKNLLK